MLSAATLLQQPVRCIGTDARRRAAVLFYTAKLSHSRLIRGQYNAFSSSSARSQSTECPLSHVIGRIFVSRLLQCCLLPVARRCKHRRRRLPVYTTLQYALPIAAMQVVNPPLARP